MNTVVFYDRDPDGLAAAAVVGHAMDEGPYEVVYRPAIRYEGPDLEGITKETTVYIVDFCYKSKFMSPLCEVAKEVVVLDHHGESTDSDLDGFTAENLTVVNDSEHAACMVTYMYLHKQSNDAHSPIILHYIQDMDLWRWVMKDSAEIAAAIDTWTLDIKTYLRMFERSMTELLREGRAIVRYKNKTMDILEKQAVLMEIAGHIVPAVNCADPSIVSYLGNRLAKGQPFAATYYMQPNLKWKFSIRSITGEGLPGISVRDIAAKFGGGGHHNASGFKVDNLFPTERVPDSEVTR